MKEKEIKEIEIGIGIKVESHGKGACFTVDVESDNDNVFIGKEDAEAITEAINKTIVDRFEREFNPRGLKPTSDITDPLNRAMMKDEFPMPEGLETAQDALDYVKSVYGIGSEEAALFDKVTGDLINDNIRLIEANDEMETDLRKVVEDKFKFIDMEKWKSRFDYIDELQKALWSGESSSMLKEDTEEEKISSKPNGLPEEELAAQQETLEDIEIALDSILTLAGDNSKADKKKAANEFIKLLAKVGELTMKEFPLFCKINDFPTVAEAGAAFDALLETSTHCRCEPGIYPTEQTEDKSMNYCVGCKKEVK